MIRQHAPMKRTAFKRKRPFPRVTLPLDDEATVTLERVAPRLYRVPAPSAPRAMIATPKPVYVDSEPYRRAVAALPCYRCGIVGYTQCCHSDAGSAGKGMGQRSCDLTCWPGCGPRPGIPGCHYEIGHGATLGREEKRVFEVEAANATKAHLIAISTMDARLRVVLVKVGIIQGDSN